MVLWVAERLVVKKTCQQAKKQLERRVMSESDADERAGTRRCLSYGGEDDGQEQQPTLTHSIKITTGTPATALTKLSRFRLVLTLSIHISTR